MSLSTHTSNTVRGEYQKCVNQVFGGDTGLVGTIETNTELAQDPTTFQSVILSQLERTRVRVSYQVLSRDRPTCYVRCCGITYRVFTEEEESILPDCPELGDDIKFVRTYNLADREGTCKENGLFVHFIGLLCGDDV
jgi:hypothetical protein